MISFDAQPRLARRAVRYAAASVGAVVLAGSLVACGGASGGTATPPSSSIPSGASSSAAGAPASGGAFGGRGGGVAPAASGTIAAVAAGSIEVQNPSSGQSTVDYAPTTTITATSKTTLAAVTVGSCVLAMASPSPGSSATSSAPATAITATTVLISKPTNGNCVGFGRAGGFGGSFPSGSRPTDRPTGEQPSGSRSPGSFGGTGGGFGGLVDHRAGSGSSSRFEHQSGAHDDRYRDRNLGHDLHRDADRYERRAQGRVVRDRRRNDGLDRRRCCHSNLGQPGHGIRM
jgi:hypothetical protein